MSETTVPGVLIDRDDAWQLVLAQSSQNRHCPYCGRRMTADDLSVAPVADNDARDPCHPECYAKHKQEDEP